MKAKTLFVVLLACSILLAQGSAVFGVSGGTFRAAQNSAGYEKPSAKARYEAKAKRTIRYYQIKIDRLREKAKRKAGAEKIKVESDIKSLQARLDTAKLKLKKLEAASARDWEKTKAELDKALAGVRSEYKKAGSSL